MKTGLLQQLESRMDSFTPAERRIANYILTNRKEIPFETAVSLAAKLDVSPVTVGRFCRLLGFKHLRALKEDLRLSGGSAPWLVGDDLSRFRRRYDNADELRRGLELEMASLVEVYHMVETPEWKAVVNKIVRADLIQVSGFQTERGLAHTLTNALQYMREGVELVDLTSGYYGEVFARTAAKRCLILIDIKRYSRQSYLVAERAAEMKIPLVLITDKHCDWGRRFTPNILAVSTETGQFWQSSVPLACLINLLVISVVAQSGAAVEKRLERVSSLFEHFTGYMSTTGGRRPK
ncbi:MurR/RpiR family transcriptional regulator [Steroidobacter sp.]|uniref:MurR/RpiR family transcriptional regulator n=1 Tax=Steroidobacter sp. TaxID=1978227 RepID=UPI001A4D7DBA|nr:MurR/RpiR family transcriptional regulator [Steroidobacter sp.]MBL8267114.1 MurR/RpiR family transcriptional regulator [Steroidobacter sp.]